MNPIKRKFNNSISMVILIQNFSRIMGFQAYMLCFIYQIEIQANQEVIIKEKVRL